VTATTFDADTVAEHLSAGLGGGPLREEQDEQPADFNNVSANEPTREQFPRLDWHQAFATDYTAIDWLPGRFMERGQQVALVGGGKVGKTLFIHNWIWCAITGRSFLGDTAREPLRVMYFDRENSIRDIVSRMVSLGAKPDHLDRFDYRCFPSFTGALDASAAAATELVGLVEASNPDIVVFDTVSRFIGGKENDADTWLSFYRQVHAPLKARGIGGVRLDHTGKDEERGARGNSAKSQDVDHVWQMTKLSEQKTYDRDSNVETIVHQLRMERTETRTGLGEDAFHIIRRGEREKGGVWLPGRTRHELQAGEVDNTYNQLVQSYVDELIANNVPAGLGRTALKGWADRRGVRLPGKNSTLADIAAALKAAQAS
jgi:hypothetical protein